jgi:L-fuconolactonase
VTATPSSNQAWLAQVVEEPLEPGLPICDPHHHLWDKVKGRVSSRYLLDEMLDDIATSGHNVVSTVFIECGAMYNKPAPPPMRPVGEVEFVNGIAAMSVSGLYGTPRVAAGIVGTADLRLGEAVGDVLDAEIAAGSGRFRGIRRAAAWDADPDVPNHRTEPGEGVFFRDDFRAGYRQLAKRQLTFEAWCYHRQIPDVTALARTFPEITIILNHFGGPLGVGRYAGTADDVYAEWRKVITELATCANVVVKLGGINMEINGFGWHERPKPPTSQELADATRRYYEATIQTFGPTRCMFESNFPVDKVTCSYGVLWNAFKRLAAGYSSAEKAALFHDTAARVYRLTA